MMRGLKGSSTLLRGRLRRGSKRERATHVATVCGWRPSARAVCAGGLRDRQALAIMAVVDFAERLVIDHDRLRSQARVLPSTPRM
jgi:hypothetical protein